MEKLEDKWEIISEGKTEVESRQDKENEKPSPC